MYTNPQSDLSAQEEIRPELLPDEQILWSGKSDPTAPPGISDVLQSLVGLLFTAFAVFWTLMASGVLFIPRHSHGQAGPPVFFPIIGVAFILVGLYRMLSPFTYRRWVRNGTTYAVTNRRIVVLSTRPWRKVTATMLKDIPTIDKYVRRNGTGTISFGVPSSMVFWGGYQRSWPNRIAEYPVFYDISEPDAVYKLVGGLKADEGKS